jgi:hypothetical protein
MQEQNEGFIEGRYNLLEKDRNMYLMRAREAAALTIPALIPPVSNSGATAYPTPYQALGARGVNNLASKLLLALFPPNSPFFKLSLDDGLLMQLSNNPSAKTQLESAFARIERSVMAEIETTGMRIKAFEALKHLIVGGNVLVYLPPTGGMRVFPLSRYVCQRDPMGNILEIVVKEDVSPLTLPDEILKEHGLLDAQTPDKVVSLYTHITYDVDEGYRIAQELRGKIVRGSQGNYKQDPPWMALRWTSIENEDYGRGFVEEYLGDLKSYEGLSKAILDGAAAAARIIYLLRPNSVVNKRRLAAAPNGSIIEGNIEDINALQLDKYADFQTALQKSNQLDQSLSMSFMLNSAIQRNGERVTAEEIRYMAGELEDALGGVYSILSQEFQTPLVRNLIRSMARQSKIPPLPPSVRPSITTGMEALGRGQDLNKLNTFLQELGALGQAVGPEAIAQRINIGDAITRIATSLGIDTQGLIKSDEEVQAEMQQQQEMEMAQQIAPQVTQASLESNG